MQIHDVDVAQAMTRISILDYLFRGGTAPPCGDVADVNRDAAVDISDPVHLLLYLFAGGGAPNPDTARCFGEAEPP